MYTENPHKSLSEQVFLRIHLSESCCCNLIFNTHLCTSMIILACVLAIASCIPWQKLLMVCFSDSMLRRSSSKSVLNISRPSRTEFCRSHTDCNQCHWIRGNLWHYSSDCYNKIFLNDKAGSFSANTIMGLILALSFYTLNMKTLYIKWILEQKPIKAFQVCIFN
jgi:hypothetical protein